ncbi:pyridoxamine 5'-phosphate oxidase family protein [Streptomyces sp. NBC_01754]|uniref:pyridoxamine 5'-phosphate oxidase family protein n=1 Tax=Streptomyces sp. NBC_01754 TaxID=2975930 RepID=UPI002DD84B2A|nr:pyridoxamine 5'-phosphate oxidase family protein [Streptomyces sp. NBC_01754]WSC93792.1 pyridoxamine 5'-phosphate oxidase family protein [Streptomyces sp. NBC_01754]
MTTPVCRRMVELPGTEALWLLESAAQGQLVYVRDEVPVLRPAVHVLEYGRLIVRTPAQAAALAARASLTYQAHEIKVAGGTGWTVTVTGPAEVITDPDEAGHYRRTLHGWAHGPHDTLVRIRPQTVTGFRLAHAEAAR